MLFGCLSSFLYTGGEVPKRVLVGTFSMHECCHLLSSPVEQFEIMPLFPIYMGWLDISITNQTSVLVTVFTGLMLMRSSIMNQSDFTNFILPFRVQLVMETYLRSILFLVYERISKTEGSIFFRAILTLSFYMFCLNVSGLVPHTAAMLSHIIITVTISGSFFIGMNILCVKRFGIKFFTVLLPPNTSVGVALILVPVEALSFFCRPLSLATRVFANSMGGHTLVKIVAGCAWCFINFSSYSYTSHSVALFIMLPLMILETLVALIQSAVFVNLICIYIGESVDI